MMRYVLVLTAWMMLLTVTVQAGSGYEVKCDDKKCGFETSFNVGGGFMFNQVQGYCKSCNKQTSLSWPRNKDEEAPKPIVEFWDSMTGQVRQVYRCANCEKAFVAIKKIEEFRHCPKCEKPTLKHNHTWSYD